MAPDSDTLAKRRRVADSASSRLGGFRLQERFDNAGSPPAGITVIIWKNPAGRKRKDGTCSIR